MNFFTMGTPLVGGTGAGAALRGRRMRDGRYDPYYLPAVGVAKPKCKAEILKPKKNLLDSTAAEGFDRCGAPAIRDDILCSVHRRQVDLAAESEGNRKSGTAVIRVPLEAFKKSRFPLGLLGMAEEKNRTEAPDALSEDKYEIWSPDDVVLAARLLLK